MFLREFPILSTIVAIFLLSRRLFVKESLLNRIKKILPGEQYNGDNPDVKRATGDPAVCFILPAVAPKERRRVFMML